MKKIIRLTESELVSLVKRTIMEETIDNEKLDFLTTLSTYNGITPALISISQQYKKYGLINLTEKQLKYAYNLLKKEFPNIKHFKEELNNPLYLLIKTDETTRKFVIKKGIEAYDKILKTDKQFLFKDYHDNLGSNITIGSPNEEWQKRNLNDLRAFYSSLGKERISREVEIDSTDEEGKKIKIKTTFGEVIKKIGEIVRDELTSFKGFTENGDWSSLNKINTNYHSWGMIIINLDSKGLLGDGSPKEKIEEFFKQRNKEDICSPEDLKHIKKIEDTYRVIIPGLSYAEYEIYKDGEKNYEFVKSNIKTTSSEGDLAEANFRGFLKINGIKDILDFSSPGNQVDMVFGVDLMAKLPVKKTDTSVEFKWIPIQVKSSKPKNFNLKIFDFNIDGITVWPGKKDEYTYISNPKDEEKSFNKDFFEIK